MCAPYGRDTSSSCRSLETASDSGTLSASESANVMSTATGGLSRTSSTLTAILPAAWASSAAISTRTVRLNPSLLTDPTLMKPRNVGLSTASRAVKVLSVVECRESWGQRGDHAQIAPTVPHQNRAWSIPTPNWKGHCPPHLQRNGV